eukprot:365338-Chlamydomonas_euryale.AAC.1
MRAHLCIKRPLQRQQRLLLPADKALRHVHIAVHHLARRLWRALFLLGRRLGLGHEFAHRHNLVLRGSSRSGGERAQVEGEERVQVEGEERVQVEGGERAQVEGEERAQVEGEERVQVEGEERVQ